jgi:serine-type D-Ala-D-Ala carboxypeptidase (penicillin-binding protein 5/6)
MLKLGSKPNSPATPKAPEADPERTSKFVALKNDMAPATRPATKPDATTPVPQVGPERTTQQPLPPKPPLDLLAELTNTPPPPETPVRTIVRRIKIWTPLVLLLAIVFAVVQTLRPLPSPTLALTGKDTYTFAGGATPLPWPGEGQGWIDADGVGNMGHFGKQTPVAIGSVAKTMTSYIILRDHPLRPGEEGPKIKIDPTAEKEGGYYKDGESTLNTVKAGDYLTEKQALSAVMIPSANNIARLLARWDLGSEAAFVKKMNDTAKELGMTSTTYTDPSGLKETTVSTAEDQVKLGRAVTKNPALVSITSAASWTDPTGHFWNNVNELPYRIGAIGIKTGSTTAAGGNLLFASRKQVDGQTVTLVGAILGQHKPKILETVNAVSKTALLAAQEALTASKILKKGDVVGYVDDQLGGHTPVVLTKDVSAVGWAGLKVRLSFAAGKVPHSAKAGTQVGALTVGDGSAGAVKVPVALQKDLVEPGFGAKLTRLG